MMVNVTELRQHLPDWLGRAQAGEEIVITHRGAAIARLVPPIDHRAEARARLEALRAGATVGDVESPLDLPWEASFQGDK